MDEVIQVINKIVAAILFGASLTFYILGYNSINNILSLLNRNEEVAVWQGKDLSDIEESIPGERIVTEIYKGLQTDIEVDGEIISNNEDVTVLTLKKVDINKRYKREAIIDAGKVEKIIYTSI